jgi:hypothetical protein
VVSVIATTETDPFWAEQVEKLPKHALEQLVRDMGREKPASTNGADLENQEPVLVDRADQEPVLVDRVNQEPVLADRANQEPVLVEPVQETLDLGRNELINSVSREEASTTNLMDKAGGATEGSETCIPRGQETDASRRRDTSVLPELESKETPQDAPHNVSPMRRSATIAIDPVVERRLADLRENLSREEGKRLSMSDVIERLLTGFRTEGGDNVPQYEEVITTCPECGKKHMKTERGEVEIDDADLARRERKGEPVILEDAKREATEKHQGKARSRYIPAAVKRVMRLEHGGMCAFPGCNRKARIHHHTRRFIRVQSHDPRYMVPLCRSHEAMAHGGLVDGETLPPGEWKLRLGEGDGDKEKQRIDAAVRRYRLRAGRQ